MLSGVRTSDIKNVYLYSVLFIMETSSIDLLFLSSIPSVGNRYKNVYLHFFVRRITLEGCATFKDRSGGKPWGNFRKQGARIFAVLRGEMIFETDLSEQFP
jgi:hypothetical protein